MRSFVHFFINYTKNIVSFFNNKLLLAVKRLVTVLDDSLCLRGYDGTSKNEFPSYPRADHHLLSIDTSMVY